MSKCLVRKENLGLDGKININISIALTFWNDTKCAVVRLHFGAIHFISIWFFWLYAFLNTHIVHSMLIIKRSLVLIIPPLATFFRTSLP